MVPPHVCMVHPHVQSNVPPLPYMEPVLNGPPHMYIWYSQHVRYDFFRPASKESTVCSNQMGYYDIPSVGVILIC